MIAYEIKMNSRRVVMQDWSALLNTSEFVLGISFALMIITLVLNLILIKKKAKDEKAFVAELRKIL